MSESLQELFNDVGEWSEKTFGSVQERGPVGPLKHLAKEVLIELLGYKAEAVEALLRRPREPANPADGAELADVLILWCDAVRRGQWTAADILRVATGKMKVNRTRTYPKPVGDEVSEHDRSAERKE